MNTTDGILLSRSELTDLTGAFRSSAMVHWLERRNWIFEPPAKSGDYPKVARAYFLSRMTGASVTGQRREMPRLSFLRGTS